MKDQQIAEVGSSEGIGNVLYLEEAHNKERLLFMLVARKGTNPQRGGEAIELTREQVIELRDYLSGLLLG